MAADEFGSKATVKQWMWGFCEEREFGERKEVDSVEKRIDFGPLELWELHSSFLHWFWTPRALESEQFISMEKSIEKSIDCGPPELWKLDSSFPLSCI